jgi:hypothetical protein
VQQVAQPAAQPPAAKPATQAAVTPPKAQPKAPTQIGKPSAATPAAQPNAPTPAITRAAPPVAAPAPQPHPAAVAFNPKTLDPKQNARLKLDLSHFPPALAFTIEMNGKLLYKGTASNKADFDNLYVPPGVHEFRIAVSAGNVEKSSNTVSVELVAKKHFTLKAELRPQPTEATPALVPATQVVATLKMDRFQF